MFIPSAHDFVVDIIGCGLRAVRSLSYAYVRVELSLLLITVVVFFLYPHCPTVPPATQVCVRPHHAGPPLARGLPLLTAPAGAYLPDHLP